MRNKLVSVFVFVLSVFSFFSCSDNIVPDFSFTPEVPKAGQTVSFTNLTTGDEDWKAEHWNWNFGDNLKSTEKNPKHIYKNAGKYSITLMVDSNKNLTKTLSITVYDSIPTIYINTDSVYYYKKSTFSVLVYNPSNLDITYKWTFSSNAKGNLTNGESSKSEVEVFFNQPNTEETVSLHIVMGNELDTIITKKFHVHDMKTKSLLMAQRNGNILRQRIYDNGFEAHTSTGISAGNHPFNIIALSNLLYIFDAGSDVAYKNDWLTNTSGNGNIRVYNMNTKTTNEIINNNGKSSHFGFYNGYVDNNFVYWTDYSEFIYKTPLNSTLGSFEWKGSTDNQTAVPYYLTKADRLGYYGNGLASNQFSGGIAYYDEAYFWAKGGSGKGIYRFLSTDILTANATGTAPVPSLGAILTDFSIRAFKIDEINQKIYFSVTAPADKVGFWVANMRGNNAERIDDAPMDDKSLYITGIAIDNVSNKVFWAYRSPQTIGASSPSGSWENYYKDHPTHRTGVKMATLATQYKPAGDIEYFSEGVVAYGIALDEVKK